MSKKYDIIIVGAGTSGMMCAIEAAQRGAAVAVVEKDTKPGGAMHWSGGHMSAGGTQLQKRKDIKDSIEDHYQDIIDINGGSGDLQLIRMAVEEAPETLNWLDDLGFPWAPECPRIIYGHVPYTKARTQYGVNKAISIFEIMVPLWEKEVSAGNITCYYNHTFSGLEQNNGSYDTVICNDGANTVAIKGKHILLTTGGYGSNPDFFHSKHGDIPLVSSTYPNATAEAFITMEQLGADFRMADYHLPSLGGLEINPGSGRANFNEAWAMVITSVYRQPRDIYVNENGCRFMAEDEVNADTRERKVIQQKDWKFWVVFDEEALMERDENGIENPIIIGWDTAKIKTEAQRNKAIFQADSIEDLAIVAGINPENLIKTVSEFNDIIDNGEDQEFQRSYLKNKIGKPPFYAVKTHASVLVTFGGLSVNNELQILDKEKKVMKGLYASGEVLGLGATSGNAFCSGMAITPALSFGRILGRKFTK